MIKVTLFNKNNEIIQTKDISISPKSTFTLGHIQFNVSYKKPRGKYNSNYNSNNNNNTEVKISYDWKLNKNQKRPNQGNFNQSDKNTKNPIKAKNTKNTINVNKLTLHQRRQILYGFNNKNALKKFLNDPHQSNNSKRQFIANHDFLMLRSASGYPNKKQMMLEYIYKYFINNYPKAVKITQKQ